MPVPPLAAFARCMSNPSHVEVHDVADLALPAGAVATLVRLTGWLYSPADTAGGSRWIEADRITALHRWAPELIGRSAGWSVRVREDDEKGRRPAADVPVRHDVALVQAALDRGLGEPLLRAPLGARVTRDARTVREAREDDGVGLDYRAGHLVARVRSHERGEAEVAQLVEILERAHPLLTELAPAPVAVDAHFGPDKPREIAPGAESFEHARELMQGPKRFMRSRETPDDDAVRSGFAASYAAARGMRSEFAPHADLEIPRYGVPARVGCSVVGALPDGRPLRLAHTTGWLGIEGDGRARVVASHHDVAITGVTAPEARALATHLPQADAWLAGPYLVAIRPCTWGRPTAAGLDAVRDRAGELVAWAAAAG